MRILLVEDDQVLGSAVRDHMAAASHGVDWARTLADARNFLDVAAYDLIVLDLSMPDGRGLDLLKALRASADTPVVIASAHDQIAARIEGLNAGADDYLIKPFDLGELSARIGAIDRRRCGRANGVRVFGDVEVDFATRRATRAGEETPLSAREWAVLARLTRNTGAIVAKLDIEHSLYALGAEVESNTVEVYVSRLRKRLGKDFITTIRGVGYKVAVEQM